MHVIEDIDADRVALANVDLRAWHHSVDGQNRFDDAIGTDTIFSKAICHIERTIETGATQHAVPLNCPIVFAQHRLRRVVAWPHALMCLVIFLYEKLYLD